MTQQTNIAMKSEVATAYKPTIEVLESDIKWYREELENVWNLNSKLQKLNDMLIDYEIVKTRLADEKRDNEKLGNMVGKLNTENYDLRNKLRQYGNKPCDCDCGTTEMPQPTVGK